MAEQKPSPPTAKAAPQKYQGKLIIASRPSRAGDPGYELTTVNPQVTVTLEDGTENVINPDNIDEVKAAREKQELEQLEKEKQEREKLAREKK